MVVLRRLFLLGLLSSLSACINETEVVEEGWIDLKAGDVVPAFSVRLDNGEIVTNQTMTGKPSLIVFFHTGCGDCRNELPVVQRIYDIYASQVNMVCISRAEKEPDIALYWEKNGFTLPYSAQEDRTVYYQFAKSGIPRIYIVDGSLVIRNVFTDDPLARYEDIKKAIEVLLSSSHM